MTALRRYNRYQRRLRFKLRVATIVAWTALFGAMMEGCSRTELTNRVRELEWKMQQRISQPNIQNIPVRTEEGRKIRKALEKHLPVIEIDYAEVEWQVVAHREDIVKQVAKLLPASRAWLEKKGYITQEGDCIQLTAAGYEYFIDIYNGTNKKTPHRS